MKSEIILVAIGLLAIASAGCARIQDGPKNMHFFGAETTTPDTPEYKACVSRLLSHANRALDKDDPDVQLAVITDINRIRSLELTPAFICPMRSNTRGDYVCFVEAAPLSIPGPAEVCITLIDRHFPLVYNRQRFNIGWRAAIDSISVTNGPGRLGDLLVFRMKFGLPMDAVPIALYYAIPDEVPDEKGSRPCPEIVLIRIEDQDRQPQLTAYGSYYKEQGIGPKPSLAPTFAMDDDRAYWTSILESSNEVAVLAAMLYLASPNAHDGYARMKDDRGWMIEPEHDGKLDALHDGIVNSHAFQALTRHSNPWIATFATSILEKRSSQQPLSPR